MNNNRFYDPKKAYKSSLNYTTCYTPINSGKIILSVVSFGLETLVQKIPEGDGMTFHSFDLAREFAFSKGYIVEDNSIEEIKKLNELKNKMNKTET